jgi:hypothetical protein
VYPAQREFFAEQKTSLLRGTTAVCGGIESDVPYKAFKTLPFSVRFAVALRIKPFSG